MPEHISATPSGSTARTSKESKNMQFFLVGFASLIGGVVIIFAVFSVIRVYVQAATDNGTRIASQILRLPLAKVNGKTILYSDYLSDLKAITSLRDFDKKNGGPSASLTDQQMSDQVVWRLANNIIINDLARNFDIGVEQKDIDDLKTQMVSQFKDTAEAENELMKRYGWTMAVYEQKVIRPYILQTKLTEMISTDQNLREEVRQKAESVLMMIKNGANFEEMAAKYGEDGTAQKGGDLGWFSKGDMVAQFETAAFALKKGELSQELVETPFGYHIIRVDDTKTEKLKDSSGKMVDTPQVSARHIIFMFPSLEKSLSTALKNADISWYVKKISNPLAATSQATQ